MKLFSFLHPKEKMLRVGIKPEKGNLQIPGYETITVLMKSHSKWGELGPYHLKTEEGWIFENVWQFAKIYEVVPASTQRYSRWDKTITWNWPAERHLQPVAADAPLKEECSRITYEGQSYDILPAYWSWRKAGFTNSVFVRYPVGFHNRHTVNCAVVDKELGCIATRTNNLETLNYIEGRKRIYLPLYCELVRKEPRFQELKKKLEKGEKMVICEVDGPHQESLDYYRKVYDVKDDFIEHNSIEVNLENMKIMLNDGKHPFGHGYCLALALLDLDQEVLL